MNSQSSGPGPLTSILIELQKRAALIGGFALVFAALAAVFVMVIRPEQNIYSSTITYLDPAVESARAQIPNGLFSSVSASREVLDLLSGVDRATIEDNGIETSTKDTPASVAISSSGGDTAGQTIITILDNYRARRVSNYSVVLAQATKARTDALERAQAEAELLEQRFDSSAETGSVAREAIVVRQVELDKQIQQLREDVDAIDEYSQLEPDGIDRIITDPAASQYTTSSNIQAIILVFIVTAMLGALLVAGAAILRAPNDDE